MDSLLSLSRVKHVFAAGTFAGLCLGVLDVLHVGGETIRHTRFRAPLLIASLLGASVLLLWCVSALLLLLLRGLELLTEERRRWAVTVFGALSGSLVGLAFFSGSGMQRLGLTRPLQLLSVLSVAFVAERAWKYRERMRAIVPAHPWFWLLVAGAFYLVHAHVLVRLYPGVHLLVSIVAMLCALLGALRIASLLVPSRVPIGWMLGVCCLASFLFAMRAPSLRSQLRNRAPLAGYAVWLAGRVLPRSHIEAAATDDPLPVGGGFDFRGLDVVLVTVDALRADRLAAYGGPAALTPAMNALASQGIVFERAYCTTPHTSYSLASLMTGKFFREVSALGEPATPHQTLARALGRAGYHTAGFYPPAVFFVDAARLGSLRTRSFDFATTVAAFDDAATRVRRVEEHLRTIPSDRRVFLWVHFFEPHEPYEARAGVGATPRERYDAEVSAVDGALRALRSVFDRSERRAVWILTADHGEEFGEHGGRFHGTTLYEEQARVPLLFAAPNLRPRRVSAPASLVDVAPTLLSALAIPRSARMRGRDLGVLARAREANLPVFASVGSVHMVTDGRHKLLCDVGDGSCELYDLQVDPQERDNLAETLPDRAQELQSLLVGWEGTHGRFEHEGSREPPMPAALERALQGDHSAAVPLAALLSSLASPVARRSVSALASLGVREPAVRDALAGVLTRADRVLVREAGLALALLGDARGESFARDALRSRESWLQRRGALALASLGNFSGRAVLEQIAVDTEATDTERDAAVDALSRNNAPETYNTWNTLLEDVRLAPRAADALGQLGDARAIPALEQVEQRTRYALTRRAALGALLRLGARDVAQRFSVALAHPDALREVFVLARELREPGRRVAGVLSPENVRARSRWELSVRGPRWRGASWLYLRVQSEAATTITVQGVSVTLRGGEEEVRVALASRSSGVRVLAPVPIRVLGVLLGRAS